MKIAALVSGGVDSSVALALLKDQGFDVTAFYLKIWLEDELAFLGTCPWQEDLFYVEKVCSQLQVPLEVVSLQKEYWDLVVRYTLQEVEAGHTPNPDIMCNVHVKFGAFYNKINTTFDKVATGHYAQTVWHNNQVLLKKAPDVIKDQTYFLSQLNQKQLQRALFPIGHLVKDQVREYAKSYNLVNKDRKDSQGICFLGKLKFSEFLHYHLGDNIGPVIEYETGKIISEHKGFWYYTIGQRQGLGLSGGPWYVVAKDSKTNSVYVSCAYYEQDKKRNKFIVRKCNWIQDEVPKKQQLHVKMRHGAVSTACTLERLSSDNDFLVTLGTQDQGIAPGQFAVFYDGDFCLGSGSISEQIP